MMSYIIKAIVIFGTISTHYSPAYGQVDSLTTQTVYEVVDEIPQFPGGISQWHEYVQKNLKYPQSALKAGIQEQLMVNFIVTQTGQIKDVHALKHPNKVFNPELVQEAERLIRSMPNWTPGKVGGRVVACRFNMPVKFTLP